MPCCHPRLAFSVVLNENHRKGCDMNEQGADTITLLPEAERGQDFAIIAEMRATFKEVPDEELERELNRAFTQARKKHRK